MEGTTKSGFHFHIDPQKLNNWKTIKRLGALTKAEETEQLNAIFDLSEILLGEEQEAALTAHVEKLEGAEEGMASFSGVTKELMEIITLAQNDGALKKSSS